MRRLIALLLAMTLLASACGGGSSGGSSGGSAAAGRGQTVEIDVASSGFAFTTTRLTATAGKVTLRSVNPQSTAHAIAVEGDGVNAKGGEVSNGGVSQVTVDLKPGTYTFFCPVDGHEQAGMKGTLVVS